MVLAVTYRTALKRCRRRRTLDPFRYPSPSKLFAVAAQIMRTKSSSWSSRFLNLKATTQHVVLITCPSLLIRSPVHFYFLPVFFSCESFNTFLTIFCSSIKNARTILSRTQLLHREPPYARETVFFGRETVAYSRGRSAGICDVVGQ